MKWKWWGNSKRTVLELALGALVLLVMLRWFEQKQVYHPSRTLQATGAELHRPFEDVLFKSPDGVELNGWFYPAQTNSARQNLVIVFCHGNGGNISHRLQTCQALLETGAGVFVFDYRGYGRSAGKPGEEGTYKDAQGACQWLRGKGFTPGSILAYGESLGGAVAAELAAREEVGGLVLQSSFTSLPDIGAEVFPWLPVRWLASIKYDTARKLPQLKVPVLVMHSRTDELIGFHHGEKLFALANPPKSFCEIEGEHNNALANHVKYVDGLTRFLTTLPASGDATRAQPGGQPSERPPRM